MGKLGKKLSSGTLKGSSQQTLFAIFWALAEFFNQFRQGTRLEAGINGLVVIGIFVYSTSLLMKPSSNFRLIVLTGLASIHFLFDLPDMPNHFEILGLVNLTIFSTWLFLKVRNKYSNDWFNELAPFLRLEFILIYGSAAIAKINSGFFDPANSCAFILSNRELHWLGINIDFTQFTFFPHLVSATELAIFFGLIFKQTRPFAVILACLFHTSLSLTPISNGLGFTFVLLGLLSLFLPAEAGVRFINFARERQVKLDKKISFDFFKFIFSFFAISIALAFLVVTHNRNVDLAIRWLFSLFILASAALTLAVFNFKSRKLILAKPVFRVKGPVQIVILSVTLITAISPYLGLKTTPTFTMFSNLEVEGNQTNHYVIPRLFHNNFADDLVTIVKSSDPSLQNDAAQGAKWVYLDLQKVMKKYPDVQITYIRNDTTYNLAKASDNPDLVNPNPIWAKLLAFRKIYPENLCRW